MENRAVEAGQTREERNCGLLFDYLKDILYGGDVQTLSVDELDEPYRRLGAGLQFLEEAVKEMLRYSGEISRGNLSGQYPPRDNFLCDNLKNISSVLNHLTWQAAQVASGDYSQRVSGLGEFSDAFNTMTGQLKERERLLKKERDEVEKRAVVIKQYNEFLMELINKRNEWILVVDTETKEIVYCNKRKGEEETDPSLCKYHLSFCEQLRNWARCDEKTREITDDKKHVYEINTFPVEWMEHKSFVHVISDVTEQKRQAEKLAMKAYHDPMTGIRNRFYYEEHMNKILQTGEEAAYCFLDLDGLKTVNDQFGHLEGDRYIQSFVAIIQKNIRSSDEFARIGGDEFAVILYRCSGQLARKKLSQALHEFSEKGSGDYISSFSYGVVEIGGSAPRYSLDELTQIADEQMYLCKRKNKEKYHIQMR
jgi:diguanylate cyclase (GGDEF)-like protein